MRTEIYTMLTGITDNVFQDYPDQDKDYPCLIYSASQVGRATHTGIGHYAQRLTVEIYSETSEERSTLETNLIETLIEHGWRNVTSQELPHPDYYRQNLTFEREV